MSARDIVGSLQWRVANSSSESHQKQQVIISAGGVGGGADIPDSVYDPDNDAVTVETVETKTIAAPAGEALSVVNAVGEGLEVTPTGEIEFKSGVTYKVETDSTSASRVLDDNDYFLVFDNPVTTEVILPSAAANSGQYYILSRRFPLQGGETIGLFDALLVKTSGGDLIDNGAGGTTQLGIPPEARHKYISDGINTWYLV